MNRVTASVPALAVAACALWPIPATAALSRPFTAASSVPAVPSAPGSSGAPGPSGTSNPSGPSNPSGTPGTARPRVAFKIVDERITESSGLAASTAHPGVVYTHNDSGGTAQIFAIGPDGGVRAVLTLAGARNRDWEAIAMGRDDHGRPAIFVADIGDNLGGAWPFVTIYRITEPTVLRDRTVEATAFRFRYSDGPRNAETMMIDPRTNRLYIASKLMSGALYEAPAKLSTSGYNTLRRIGGAPPIATDGAFAPDGNGFVIRTYFGARVYRMKPDGTPGDSHSIPLPSQEQGESVTYTPDGSSLLVGSEGRAQPVLQVPLTGADAVGGTAPPPDPRGLTSPPAGKDDHDEGHLRHTGGRRVALLLVLGIAGLVGYGLVRRRS
ncbi:hypothetical protein DZF91_11455 [Actinomadura logoneensis]|uniref:WD40 repeat domain-containing protein n=1 Tax=Actinomadura logoneensis TaxID=2293572 RepID=A0A372JQA2_9ACTN|nr:hypothetical protein [Actinomadura logoneensis]RFU41508.1 hypothetical protein DZF91_11455 [Actinomadura logoneensis]